MTHLSTSWHVVWAVLWALLPNPMIGYKSMRFLLKIVMKILMLRWRSGKMDMIMIRRVFANNYWWHSVYIHWIHCIHYNVPTCCLNPMVIWTENYIRRMLILTPTTGVLGGGLAAASKAIGYKSMHWWGTTDHNFNWWSRPDLPIANTCIKIS